MSESLSVGKPFDPYRALREIPLKTSSDGVSPVDGLDNRVKETEKDSDSGFHASFESILSSVVDQEIDGLKKVSDLMEKDGSSLESMSKPSATHFDPRPNISGFYDSKSAPHDWSTKN